MYETADGRFVALAAVEDKFWRALCDWLGRPELAAAPYDTHLGRMEGRAALGEEIAAALGARPLAEIVAAGKAHDFPAEGIRGFAELGDNPHLKERRALRRSPEGGVVPDFPVLANGRRSFASDRQPDRAEDERWLLAELDVDPDAEARLRATGVLPQPIGKA